MRGIASLLVVVFHYKHFSYDPRGWFDASMAPLRPLLFPIYEYGLYFVELFFTLSGFIFFWLYSKRITDGQMPFPNFISARLTRLYPLYFVTLLACVLLLPLFNSLYGYDFIYSDNSFTKFLLSVLMIQQWLPNQSQSFNGPNWSISVEIFLYLSFFVTCSLRVVKPYQLLLLAILGFIFKTAFDPAYVNLARGISSFYLGGFVYALSEHWRDQSAIAKPLSLLALVGWIIAIIVAYLSYFGIALPKTWDIVLNANLYVYGLMPLSVLATALHRNARSAEWLKTFSWLGTTSYSLYLIHFPLQCFVMIALSGLSPQMRHDWLSSPVMMVLFLSACVLLAQISYHYFEMPAQRYFKSRFA